MSGSLLGFIEKKQNPRDRLEVAYSTVHTFWRDYGDALQAENGPFTFKHDLVQKMGQLHPHIAAVMDSLLLHQHSDSASLDKLQRKIGDILHLQIMHMIQFASRQDEFNRYLSALGRIEAQLQHRGLQTQDPTQTLTK